MKRRILIIEDEPLLRDVYALILKKEGYEVDMAENGKVGLRRLKSFKPDLVMLDMLMPVLDGKGFLQTVKLPIKYPETKLIIVSNVSEPLNDEEVDKYGVDDLILKVNLSPVELVNTVKKHTK